MKNIKKMPKSVCKILYSEHAYRDMQIILVIRNCHWNSPKIWAFKLMKILDDNLIEQLCYQGLNNPRKMKSKISGKALSNFKTQEK